jgi:DNA-binding transcriptional LysR family regulator
MSNMPDLEGWAVFAKVAELRSFTAAAEALGLSKATASKAVTRLEGRVGAKLFHRTSRRLSLTPTGQALAGRASTLLQVAEATEDAARDEAVTPRGLVRIAAPMSFGIAHVGPVLPALMQAYPQIAIDLHLSDQRVDLVEEGFDLAIRIGRLADSSLRSRRIADVRRHIVAAPSYIERHGRPAHPSELKDHACLGYAYLTEPDRWRFTKGAEEYVATPSGPLRINNADAGLPAVRAGLVIALMPDFAITDSLRTGKLEILLADWEPPALGLQIVTPPGGPRPSRVQIVIDYLADSLAKSCGNKSRLNPT